MPRDNAANLYVYPAEADYVDARPLEASWTRMDSSVRETDDDYVLPARLADRPEGSALVYLSLGSLGGADVELMQRLVDVLGTTRHRFIVSKGPQADRITLADNMVGEQMVPQTKVIPQVDLVISHGGNNTVTETLHFGKPLIVLPLFWDQYENAQRIDELGFGVRLDTYGFADAELTDAVDKILADTELRDRLEEIGEKIRARDGLRVGRRHHRTGRAPAATAGSGRPGPRPATIVLDSLDLADGLRLAVVARADGLAALPQVRCTDGSWRRARAGDGAAEALLALINDATGITRRGRFTLYAWPAPEAVGERAITADQTNESVIVGDTAVVKWATHLQEGPHPAPRRLEVLRSRGFRYMPAAWAVITWSPVGAAETLVANVDEYLPGAVDGWTWAVDLVADSVRNGTPGPVLAAATDVGVMVAELHAALAGTATTASVGDADRWRDAAFATLEDARALGSSEVRSVLGTRLGEVERTLATLGGLAGCPVIEGHGDLHAGQVLRCAQGFVVTDFDGNPVLPPQQRVLPIPAALDVAGMTQSLAHVAIVARRHNDLDAGALAVVDDAARHAFLDAYARHLAALGYADLYDPATVRAFRLQQVLREIIYAAKHLPHWMYVPEAALPALLDEGSPGEP